MDKFIFEQAIKNMGYRYMGRKNDRHVYGKPVGNFLIGIIVDNNAEFVEDIYKMAQYFHAADNNETLVYTSLSMDFNKYDNEENIVEYENGEEEYSHYTKSIALYEGELLGNINIGNFNDNFAFVD